MKHLRKPTQDTLILVALLVVGLVAALFEHGPADGFKIVGSLIYVGCVMTLGFAAWRSFGGRSLSFTLVEWCVAAYAGAYALASLALGWPFGFLTVLGLIIPFVVLSVFSVCSRFGWW